MFYDRYQARLDSVFRMEITEHKHDNFYVYKENVQEPWFGYIKSGMKTVEGRLDRGDWKNMKVGDWIVWKTPGNDVTVLTRVVGIRRFGNFKEMIENGGVGNVLPGYSEAEKGVEEVYYKFYSQKLEAEFGVLGIWLEVEQHKFIE